MAGQGFLLLRLEAPLMSFGGPLVDQIGRTRPFPGRAQVTGLLANALGWTHGAFAELDALQARLRIAAAVFRPGTLVRDYQIVDLGRAHLSGTGWTTRGRVEERAGASGDKTHQRYRWYVADGLVVVALTLVPDDPTLTLPRLAAALHAPARPLFIGRKSCLPTAPLLLAEVQAHDAVAALRQAASLLTASPAPGRWEADVWVEMDAHWLPPAEVGEVEADRLVDGRDWANQAHVKERAVHRFTLPLATEANP